MCIFVCKFDLWFEILVHLPVISLLRFKSVSKSFHSLITSPLLFVAKHMETTNSTINATSSPTNLFSKSKPNFGMEIIGSIGCSFILMKQCKLLKAAQRMKLLKGDRDDTLAK